MIETPSLRARVMTVTLVLVGVLTIGLDVFVYLSLRERLEETLSAAGIDLALDRLLLLELVGTLVVMMLAVVVAWRMSAVVTRPVERMVDVAHEIAAGRTGERLNPSDPTTTLGRMAAAFDETLDALGDALDEARAADETSRRFLADAAHQLRTPVAGARASAEALLRDPDGPDREQLLANVARESARASRLVASLLRVARLERGEIPAADDVDLAGIVEEEVARAATLAPDLTVVADTGGPAAVRGDRQALKEAIANLLDNARRHARSRVEVTVVRRIGAVTILVADDGPGVPPEARDRVFDRFVSLDGEGSGLGLPIARGIARAHGGDLVLADDRFEFVVPEVARPASARVRVRLGGKEPDELYPGPRYP